MRRYFAFFLTIVVIAVFFITGSGVRIQSPDAAPVSRVEAAEVSSPDTATRLTPYLEPNGDVVLFDFEHPDEAGRFVYGNVNTFVEPTNDVARTGSTSCAATFYVGSVRQGKRLVFYTLMHPARGRMVDWSPYSEFQAAILNSEDFTVTIEVEYADLADHSVWRRYSLPPKVWSRLRQPLADLENEGLELGSMKRISWSQIDTEMAGINTMYFDDIRLITKDPAASEAAVSAAWQAFEDWLMEEGSAPRASYIPDLKTDQQRISEIQDRYDCGHLDGYILTDVCVVGGGMSGTSAAIASGRLGVETLLVEQYDFLGGTATAAMVAPMMPNTVNGQDLVKGIFEDIVQALEAEDAMQRDRYNSATIYFDKEKLKYVLNELVIDSGCKMLLHSWAESPLVKDKNCEGIIVDNKSGRIAILAKVVVDATGDGDIAAGAGCEFEIGRGYDQYSQSVTLFFRMGGVNESVAFPEQYSRTDRPEGQIPADYLFADIFRAGVEDGTFPADVPISQLYFERTTQPGVVSINATRAFEVDATNACDMTYASVETRRQAIVLADFIIKNIPGFGNSFLQETGVQVGVRESRRIIGEYELTGKDVLDGRRFDDVIARGSYGIDIHCADFSGCGVVGLKLEGGASYDIPYRCLVPMGVENLLLAGRCISVSHIALGSVRIMPVACGTGHAAGVAAALSVKKNTTPRALNYYDLRNGLIAQGAAL